MIIGKSMISVVVPLYNKGPYIAHTLDSILAQSFKNFEVIVIDDGSTDEGPDIVKKYLINDNRVRLVGQSNSGVSAARNRGIAEAKSDIVAFLDADDVWKPTFLETIFRLWNRFPQAGAYATAYEIVYPSGKIIVPNFRGIPEAPWEGFILNYFKVAQTAAICHPSTTAVPKSIFSAAGLFPESEPLGEDLDMWARIALKFPIAFSNKVCARYHLDRSESTFKAGDTYLKQHRPVVKTLKRAISKGECNSYFVKDVYDYMAIRQIQDSRICLVHTMDKKSAREMVLDAQPVRTKIKLMKIFNLIPTLLPISFIRALFKLKQLYKYS